VDFRASHRYARISPRKARYVVDLVRGQNVNAALATLDHTPRRAAHLIKKVVQSALANATHHLEVDPEVELDTDELYVKEARVDPGPTHKRWMSRSMGRVNQILKRTSHISIVLATPDQVQE